MASTSHCWTCGAKLTRKRYLLPEDCFFYCSVEHKNEYRERNIKKYWDTQHDHNDKVKANLDFRSLPPLGPNGAVINQNPNRKVYTCKVCGQPGHNSRSCKQINKLY